MLNKHPSPWLFAALLTPTFAHAEVMDKEPSLFLILAWCLLGSALVLGLPKKWWPASIAIILMQLAFFVGLLMELNQPFVGPAMRAEAGSTYILSAYTAPLFVLTAATYRFLKPRRKKKA